MSFRRVPCRDVVVANDGVYGCGDVVTCPSDECHAVTSLKLLLEEITAKAAKVMRSGKTECRQFEVGG